jgi:hypothetical protein
MQKEKLANLELFFIIAPNGNITEQMDQQLYGQMVAEIGALMIKFIDWMGRL